MVMVHAFVALAAGFAVALLFVLALRGLLQRVAPSLVAVEAHPGFSYATVNFGGSFLAGAAGGCTTAWVASANPMVHVLALGIILLALAGLSALQMRDKQPVWYQLAQVALTPLGVLAGGLLRLRLLGIL